MSTLNEDTFDDRRWVEIKKVQDGALVLEYSSHRIINSVEGIFAVARAKKWARDNFYEVVNVR